MSKGLVLALFLLGIASCATAQDMANNNVAAPPAGLTLADNFSLAPSFSPTALEAPLAAPMATSTLAADPALPSAPAPQSGFYGNQPDYRWELGMSFAVVRFRSSVFYATAPGLDTSVIYNLNEWLGVEGNVVTAFSPSLPSVNYNVKYVNYSGGARIIWRGDHRWARWQPWMHALVGGAHILPQTGLGSPSGWGVTAGGGMDYRLSPQFSLRAEVDWVRTSLFSQTQNNAQAMLGIVYRF